MAANTQTTIVRVRHGEDRVEVIVASDDDGLHVSVSVNDEPWVEPPVAEADGGNGSAPPPGNGDGGNGGG